MKKKTIIGLIIVLIVIIAALLVIAILSKKNNKKVVPTHKREQYNTREEIVKKVDLEGLEIDNIKLKIEKTNSTLTADVTNKTDDNINLRIIYIYVKDKDNKKITTLRGYIGNVIKPGEKKIITSEVNRNLKDAYSFEYELLRN